MKDEKQLSEARGPVLSQAERAVSTQIKPRMGFLDTLRASVANSSQVRDAVVTVVGDQLQGVMAINRTVVEAETTLVTQKVYLDYAERVKALAPEVVRSAIEISAGIETTRSLGYKVMDEAFKQAVKVIEQNTKEGIITNEDAARRAAESIRAYREDEEYLNALLVAAKEANRHIAMAAVARVKGLFNHVPTPDFDGNLR